MAGPWLQQTEARICGRVGRGKAGVGGGLLVWSPWTLGAVVQLRWGISERRQGLAVPKLPGLAGEPGRGGCPWGTLPSGKVGWEDVREEKATVGLRPAHAHLLLERKMETCQGEMTEQEGACHQACTQAGRTFSRASQPTQPFSLPAVGGQPRLPAQPAVILASQVARERQEGSRRKLLGARPPGRRATQLKASRRARRSQGPKRRQ